MNNLLLKLKNSIWPVKLAAAYDIRPFAAVATADMRNDYRGKSADIFFDNKGRVIHKWLHYLPIYDSLLEPYEAKPSRMLEIGVFKGGSLAMWRKLLGDDATIFGIDIRPECAALDSPREHVRIGSQDDAGFLRGVVAEMGGLDIVIDDGSHVASHQVASFETLWPLLSDGGVYIVEDCHTSYWPEWEGGLRRPGTIIEFFKDRIDEMHRHYLNGANDPGDVASISFFDSIIAVRKRRQLPRHHVKTGE